MAYRGGRVAALVLSIVLVLASCDTAKVAPSPSGPVASGPVSGSPGPATTGGPRPTRGPATAGKPAPLPLPTITDAGEIGMALYNPGQVGQAVTSLLSLLGIGVYDADGNVITPGNERAEGDPWLTEAEVRGLIEMGVADLLESDNGPKFTLRDLYEPLAEALPGVSFEDFIAAYRDSYASHPDDLAPLAMIGQPMDENAQLTRTHLWLLFLDGFVDLAPPATARPANGTLSAVTSPQFGTANAVLPLLLQPDGMAAADWVEIRAHLPTIAYTVQFEVDLVDAHEGHGGTGAPVTVTASVKPSQPFLSAIAPHRVLLQPNPGSLGGLDVEWATRSQATLNRHGTLNTALSAHIPTDAAGVSSVVYTPDQEEADGHGFLANEIASLSARAKLADLLRAAYLIDNTTFQRMLGLGTLGDYRLVHGGIDVEWHTPGIYISVTNEYEVKLELTGALPFLASAYRKGIDNVQGVMFRLEDGTYVGTLTANSTTERSSYQYDGTLAGKAECQDEEPISSYQELYVVGLPSDRTLDATDVILDNPDGTIAFPADRGLTLRFFPITTPTGDFGCQRTFFYDWYANAGIAPTGVSLVGDYIPLNDLRWNNPTIGYGIILPVEGEINYEDRAQSKFVTGIQDIHSVWEINVDLNPPE